MSKWSDTFLLFSFELLGYTLEVDLQHLEQEDAPSAKNI